MEGTLSLWSEPDPRLRWRDPRRYDLGGQAVEPQVGRGHEARSERPKGRYGARDTTLHA